MTYYYKLQYLSLSFLFALYGPTHMHKMPSTTREKISGKLWPVIQSGSTPPSLHCDKISAE